MNGNRSTQGKGVSKNKEISDHFSYYGETNHNSRKRKNNTDSTSFKKRVRQEERIVHENLHHLLPIKRHGKIIWQSPVAVIDINKTITDSTENDVSNEKGNKDEMANKSTNRQEVENNVSCVAQLFARRQHKLSVKKDIIAHLACAIVENPEQKLDSLEELRQMCEEDDTDIAITVRKLAMVSLTEIFKDVLPCYRIRIPSVKEKANRVSKDVRKLRLYESKLLKNYQRFLKTLEEFVADYKRKRKRFSLQPGVGDSVALMDKALATTAIRCLCSLLLSLTNFNFYNNILAIVIGSINSNDLEISQCSYKTVNTLYENDILGEISLEGVKITSKFAKSKNFNVKERVLDTFLSLRFSHERDGDDTDTNLSSKEKRAIRRHEKKQNLKGYGKLRKEIQKLNEDLVAVEVGEKENRRFKLNTETLKYLFSVYFQVLKSDSKLKLLPSVLKGIAKFAPMISIDYFADIMTVLGQLLDIQILNDDQRMYCILTAFKILTGRGEALNIDPNRFYAAMYGILLRLPLNGYKNNFLLLIECLQLMLCKKRKQVTTQRLFAYIKRLCSISLLLDSREVIALQSVLRSLLRVYSKAGQLLDRDGIKGKLFLPYGEKPDQFDSDNAVLWELALLKSHYHPTVSTYSKYLSLDVSLDRCASLEQPWMQGDLVSIYDIFSYRNCKFHPPFPEEKRYFKQKHQKSLNVVLEGMQWTQTDLLELLRKALKRNKLQKSRL